ncbi:MAG: BatD family protein [Pseudomonadota bacterium]
MVVQNRLVQWLLTGIALLLVVPAQAGVTARVDRPSVDLNESFLLEIVIDTNIDMEPDLTVLDQDFYRGQVSHLSNTSIINGQIRRSRTWQVALMAKQTGTLTIPAITVGNEQSTPVTIVINEPRAAPPGEADVFVTSEVDQDETYVQAQVLYRIKVYRAVQTRQPALRDPVITGAETLVELAGDERTYEAILNGKAYNVHERVVALYPQESGEISISPARFEARVLRDGRITGRKVFDSKPHTITVNPIPAPPADHPNAVWLPARDVALSEDWSREPRNIDAGEPVTRHVTVSALGQLETQIPAIDPPAIDGMNVYADKPDLSRRIEADGIRGVRKDQYAMIGIRGGPVEIPELVVPWFDIDADEWRVARLPGRTIDIIAPTEPALPPAEVDAPVEDEPATAAAEGQDAAPVVDGGFWKLAAEILGVLWLLTLVVWWWSSRDRQRQQREPPPPPIYQQQARFVKAARKAAASNDAAGVKTAILEWGRLQWPGDAPRSIGAFASRVEPPLADLLRDLSAASYGSNGKDWDSAALAQALRKIVPLKDERAAAEAMNPLPPLMPPGT